MFSLTGIYNIKLFDRQPPYEAGIRIFPYASPSSLAGTAPALVPHFSSPPSPRQTSTLLPASPSLPALQSRGLAGGSGDAFHDLNKNVRLCGSIKTPGRLALQPTTRACYAAVQSIRTTSTATSTPYEAYIGRSGLRDFESSWVWGRDIAAQQTVVKQHPNVSA